MKEWDYAEMAKAAKCYGGPQKYVEMIETNAFKKGEGTGILVGVVLTSITWVGSHLWGKRKERRKQEEQEAKEAKKYLIQKLNEEETEEKCEE